MGALSSIEREAIDRASAEPMLDQVLAWSAVNSGSRNLSGLERMADLLADAFAALPGILRLEDPHPGRSRRWRGPDLRRAARTPSASEGSARRAGAAALHRPHGYGLRRRSRVPGRRAGSKTAC